MIVSVVLVAGAIWGFRNLYFDNSSLDDLTISESSHEESRGELEPQLESVPAEKYEATTGKKNAKSIVRVPGKTHQELQPERDLDIELQESTKKMLEAALNGEAEKAINIGELARQCNQQMTEERVRIRLDRMSETDFKPQTKHSFGNSQMRSFKSFEEFESTLWAEYDQCRAIQNLFNDDLRERLQLLAAKKSSYPMSFYRRPWPVRG